MPYCLFFFKNRTRNEFPAVILFMNKIIVAPDSFKGSLSATAVCESLEKGILSKLPEAHVVKIPLADGGEGSLEAVNYALKAGKIVQMVKDPLWRTTEAFYLRAGQTAYIEMAQAAGLHKVKESLRDPELAHTYGVGQQIKHAVKNGCRVIYLFVGGSATNDAGLGIAYAFGYRFLDTNGAELLPGGETLEKMVTIQKPESLPHFELKVICDVQNPLFGEQGAAYVYAPQKGADAEMVKRLDKGLQNFDQVVKKELGKELAQIPGAGAAGGVPAGMMAFFDAEILPGVQTIMKILNLEAQLLGTDLIITGEGKLDKQTLSGKLIAGIAAAGQKYGIKVRAICGKNELTIEELSSLGIEKAVSLVNEHTTTEEAMTKTAQLLEERVGELL